MNSPSGRRVGHQPKLNLAKRVSFCLQRGTARLDGPLTCRLSKVKSDSPFVLSESESALLCPFFSLFVFFFVFFVLFLITTVDQHGQTGKRGNPWPGRLRKISAAVTRCQQQGEDSSFLGFVRCDAKDGCKPRLRLRWTRTRRRETKGSPEDRHNPRFLDPFKRVI